MTFGTALEHLKCGRRITREGWNGKNMFLLLVPMSGFIPGTAASPWPREVFLGTDLIVECTPWIGMKTADDKFVPWLASQTDLLAEDWKEVVL